MEVRINFQGENMARNMVLEKITKKEIIRLVLLGLATEEDKPFTYLVSICRMAAVTRQASVFLDALRELRAFFNDDYREIHQLLKLFMNVLFPQGVDIFKSEISSKERTLGNGQFPYIPSSLNGLSDLKSRHPEFFKGTKFVDIGCGVGDKVFAAEFLSDGMKCEGVEFDHTTFDVARHIFHNNYRHLEPIEFHQADALKFDFSGYDRVYTYLPMQDKKEEFYTHIWSQLPPGALWFEVSPGAWDHTGKKVRKAEKITPHLYRVPIEEPKRKRRKKKEAA